MMYHIIQFVSLLLLMLVTGVFWGPWLSLHRSLHVFKAEEFIQLVKALATNLAMPMRVIMPGCILFMILTIWFFPEKNSFEFYFILASLGFAVICLVVTLTVELPIVMRIQQWTGATVPSDWEAVRNRWVKFHVVRVISSIASFACFIASVLF